MIEKKKWSDDRKKIMQEAFDKIKENRLRQICNILAFYETSPIKGLNHNDIAAEMEMDRKSIRPYLKELLDEGSIKKRGDKYILAP